MPKKPIIIIGAGPVGLWTACECKLRNPADEVIVLERYPTYQRKHTIKLINSSLLLYSKTTNSPEKQKLLQSLLSQASTWSSWRKPLDSHFIRTSHLETSLKEYATSLGVVIQYTHILSRTHLLRLFPTPELVICADGAHSKLRTECFGPVEPTSLQFTLDLRFNLTAQPPHNQDNEPPMRTLQKLLTPTSLPSHFRLCKQLKNLITTHVGKPSADNPHEIPLQCRLFLSPQTHTALQQLLQQPNPLPTGTGSYKDPLNVPNVLLLLKTSPSPHLQKLQKTITALQAAWAAALQSNPETQHYQLQFAPSTLLTLNIYRTPTPLSTLHTSAGPIPLLFVGDAAFGVPYFRALNAGLLLASRLAHIYRGPFTQKTAFHSVRKHLFLATFWLHWSTEKTIALSKNTALNLLQRILR